MVVVKGHWSVYKRGRPGGGVWSDRSGHAHQNPAKGGGLIGRKPDMEEEEEDAGRRGEGKRWRQRRRRRDGSSLDILGGVQTFSLDPFCLE